MKVLKYQSVIDLAVENSGKAENAVAYAAANGLAITDDVEDVLPIAPDVVTDVAVVSFYANRNIKPATAVRVEDVIEAPNTGIGYMAIEIDNIVG